MGPDGIARSARSQDSLGIGVSTFHPRDPSLRKLRHRHDRSAVSL